MAETAIGAVRVRPRVDREGWIRRGALLVILLYLLIALILPLFAILKKSGDYFWIDLGVVELEVDSGDGWTALGVAHDIAPARIADDLTSRAITSRTMVSGRQLFREVEVPDGARVRLRAAGEGARIVAFGEDVAQGEWAEAGASELSKLSIQSVKTFSGGNYLDYFRNPALNVSIVNSLVVAVISTVICVALAFAYAYALTRSCVRFKPFFRIVATVPLLAPSLLSALALVYLFGNQGVFKDWLFGETIYGPIGVVIGEVFWTFPHALLILTTALATADARLYEAAQSLGAGRVRMFFTVTLPGVRYGLVSAIMVVFTLVFTDFGVPKVIGGQYNVLATDIYKQVIGQQNFEMGAVVAVLLMIPAALAFVIDRAMQKRQVAQLTAQAAPLRPRPDPRLDGALAAFCAIMTIIILGVIGTAGFASIIQFWPYDLTPTLRHYDFRYVDGGGWDSFWNSLEMAAWTALIGTTVIFTAAYFIEKTRDWAGLRGGLQFLCMMPMAVPGIVLGLSYIMFFNAPDNPLGFMYRTMGILVLATVVHFYTVAHLTAVTTLKQIDPEFESVSASLKAPFYVTFARVTVPVSLPAITSIAIYLFLNAMTTVSAVVFLYSADTSLASVAVLNMDDAGDTAAAAAMAMTIVFTAALARLLHGGASWWLERRTQRWRRR